MNNNYKNNIKRLLKLHYSYIILFTLDLLLTNIGLQLGLYEGNRLYYYLSDLFNISILNINVILHSIIIMGLLIIGNMLFREELILTKIQIKLITYLLLFNVIMYITISIWNLSLIIISLN